MPDFTMRRHHSLKEIGRGFATCGLVVLGLFLSSCAKREEASSGILRISQRNEPATLDPQLATLPDEYFPARALFEGLTVPNPDGPSPLPGIAESWQPSPDGLLWTFRLRADATW
jgi:oligopeptide transport system substrate-binding protein